jgi:hypothetical protein
VAQPIISNNPPPAGGNSDTPYGSIVTRNVFGLNPIPQQTAAPSDAPPPPKITLTGITTIFGPAEALYKVAGVVKPGQPPQDESYILQEGQGEDGVEVVHIDVDNGKVTFNNNGVMQDLLLTAGVASGGAAPSPMPGPNFGGPRGYGGQRPNFNNLPAALRQRFEQRYNSQNGTSPTGNNDFNPAGQSGYNNNGNNSTAASASTGFNIPMPGLTGEDQQALIAAQHAQLQQEGNPQAALFPPTKFDQEAAGAGGGAEQPAP